jgi:hypothetical protein
LSRRSSSRHGRLAVVGLVLGLLAAAGIGSYLVIATNAASPNSTFIPHRMELVGEFVVSRAPVCSAPILVDRQGLVEPLLCDGGDINLRAYNALATYAPFLGANEASERGPGVTEETSAFDMTCGWVRSSNNPGGATFAQLRQSWQLAARYFGWSQNFPQRALVLEQCGSVGMNSEDQ